MEITCSKIEQVQLFQKTKMFNYRDFFGSSKQKKEPPYANTEILKDYSLVSVPVYIFKAI